MGLPSPLLQTVLAVWGAVLSTFLATGQAVSAIYRRRPHVTVEISTDVEGDASPGDEFLILSVVAVNRGSRAVQVAGIGWFERADGHERRYAFEGRQIRERLPHTIEPLAIYRASVLPEEVLGEGRGRSQVGGWIRLSTGQVVRSKLATL